MLLDIFIKAINIILKQKQEKTAGDSDFLYIQKRQIFHKDIPDLRIIKELTGERFDQLLKLFNSFDPVKAQKLKDNPDKYLFLTKTIIFKLPLKKTRQAIADLIALEFSLWFKHDYINFDKKEELIEEVVQFKNRAFRTDPFESYRKDK